MEAGKTGTLQIRQNAELSKADSMDDRNILLAVQKFFTEKNCFRQAKPGKKVLEFFGNTTSAIRTELASEQISKEKVFTVLANVILLLNNAAAKSINKLSVYRYDVVIAFEYLESVCHLNEEYKRVQEMERKECARNKAVSTSKKKRISKILEAAFIALLVILLLVFLSGFFLTKPPVAVVESKSFFVRAYDWVRFDVFGSKKPETPVSFWEKYRPYTYMSGIIFFALFVLSVLGKGVKILGRAARRFHRKKVKKDWEDYQILRKALMEAGQQLSELGE